MSGLDAGLLEKLFDDAPGDVQRHEPRRWSMDEYKDSVVRDVEDLLNSRSLFDEERLERFPECTRSLATYGVPDFSGRSLVSAVDRECICRALEQALARHEPRLVDAKVHVSVQQGAAGVLRLTIDALLIMEPALEQVSFEAFLRPAILQYTLRRTRGVAPS